MLGNELIAHCGPREKMPSAFFKISRSCLTTSSSRLRRRTSSRLCRLMSTAWQGFGAMLCQLFAPLVDRGVRNAQLACDLRDWLAARLRPSHRFALQLDRIGLLLLCHDPFLLCG